MKLVNRRYYAFDLIRMLFVVAPGWALVVLILRITLAAIPLLTIFVAARFIDTALSVVSGEAVATAMNIPILMLGFLATFGYFANVFIKLIRTKILIATRLTYRVALIEKRSKLAYRHIENQDTYDLIKRLTDPADGQLIEQFENIVAIASVIVQILSILSILLATVWWTAPLIALFAAPSFYFSIRAGKVKYDAERDISKVERKAWYLNEVCSGRAPALERTLFGFAPKMAGYLWQRFEFARKHHQNVLKKEETTIAISGMLTNLSAGAVFLILLQPVATGNLSVGLFIALTTASLTLVDVLTNHLPGNFIILAHDLEYLKELTLFAMLEETEDALSTPSPIPFEIEKVEFKNVSFTYPEAHRRTLKDVNLVMKRGTHYAFVGENGAGKTTVIKLLTGQYPNYDGEILINEKELRTYTSAELKAIFSVVYQDFARYAISVRENISVGNFLGVSDTSIDAVIKDLELESLIKQLPDGLETPLGKIHEKGVDISGGQWQRLALARAIINPSPLKILDEPTAALDPMSESRLYEQFEKIVEKKHLHLY